ncbi:septum formation initiator family protein [Flavobacteriaceae bacterium F08102]|nr:septum formation initiator family protein [Flavobacteriaceae bacterium F08102]
MTFNEIKNRKVFKLLSNRYVLIFLLFLIWMLFFDENSYLNHRELDREEDKLRKTNQYYQNEISKDKKIIKNLANPDSLERYGREEYRMKRMDEDIFIIEFDSL